MDDILFNIWRAKCGKDEIAVGHDIYLCWFVKVDGGWSAAAGHTKKLAREDAHAILHRGAHCQRQLEWQLLEGTRKQVLGECPKCLNPGIVSDLKTFRECPDCGWRMAFTKEEMEALEKKLNDRH